jgi:glycosyltransferase involved in cell wall biosynthesis
VKKVLFLYTELADYFLACIAALESQADVQVVHWPVNPEAPFALRTLTSARLTEKPNRAGLVHLVADFAPDVIFTSGWVDRDYTDLCKKYRGRIPVVLLLDNPWEGKIRQRLAAIAARLYLRARFSHAWVPGDLQARYAGKLGFSRGAVATGFYVADLTPFRQAFHARSAAEETPVRRLLYTGRYVSFKGVETLWSVFAALHARYPHWELWCAGTGALWDTRPQHAAIRHFGFVQPEQLPALAAQCHAFVLPSLKEPWGVVVQEMAAAGLPLLCSRRVGAAGTFVSEGVNGWLFDPGDPQSLTQALTHLFDTPAAHLMAMGQASYRLAGTIDQQQWVQTALRFASAHA